MKRYILYIFLCIAGVYLFNSFSPYMILVRRKHPGIESRYFNSKETSIDNFAKYASLSPVVVTWKDSCYQAEKKYRDYEPIEIFTCGYLMHESEEAIAVALEYIPELYSYRYIITIPKKNIFEITELKGGHNENGLRSKRRP